VPSLFASDGSTMSAKRESIIGTSSRLLGASATRLSHAKKQRPAVLVKAARAGPASGPAPVKILTGQATFNSEEQAKQRILESYISHYKETAVDGKKGAGDDEITLLEQTLEGLLNNYVRSPGSGLLHGSIVVSNTRSAKAGKPITILMYTRSGQTCYHASDEKGTAATFAPPSAESDFEVPSGLTNAKLEEILEQKGDYQIRGTVYVSNGVVPV